MDVMLLALIQLMGVVMMTRGCVVTGVLLSLLGLGGCLDTSSAQGMSTLSRIAMEKTPLDRSFEAVSIYGDFLSINELQIHFWLDAGMGTSNTSSYRMIWATTVKPRFVGEQVIELKEPVTIEGPEMLGIYNLERPGPIESVYCENTKLVTSLQEYMEASAPQVGDVVIFDDLAFPYCIPIKFCERMNCSDVVDNIPTPPSTTTTAAPGGGGKDGTGSVDDPNSSPVVSDRVEEVFQSTEFMIGLIVWNIILTILIFVIICVIMCIVNDSERRDRREKRTGHMDVSTTPSRSGRASYTNEPYHGIDEEGHSAYGEDKNTASAHYAGAHDGAHDDKDTLDP